MKERLYCPTIYGPKESRRQGLSLGINLGDPDSKSCTFGCIYCQCGFGTRAEGASRYPARADVLAALAAALELHPQLDSVTLAGNSEPMTYPEILDLVREVRALREARGARWIFNTLSNGSELERAEVREACDLLDEAWIKFDCGVDELFRRLNKPLARIGVVADQVRRTKQLKAPRIQTLLWTDPTGRNLGNLGEENLRALVDCYRSIRPVDIHVTTIARPPATSGLTAAPMADLERFAQWVREAGFKVSVFP